MSEITIHMNLTEEDLKQMNETLRVGLNIRTQFKKDYWMKGFFAYNMEHPESERLSVNCYPCYTKVYLWCKEKMKKQ